jgi:uncharacterized protein (TIGR00369 family)
LPRPALATRVTPNEAVRSLDNLIRHPPFHAWLHVEATDAGPGFATLRIPPNPDFVGNPFIPAVHGGIIAALIDLAGGAALFVELQFPTPTIDMRVDYLRPAIAGKALVARATVKRLGSTVAFVDIDVTDEDDRLVATGRCAYSVKDRDQGPRGFPIG